MDGRTITIRYGVNEGNGLDVVCDFGFVGMMYSFERDRYVGSSMLVRHQEVFGGFVCDERGW